jgi:hypothetical protein
LECFKPCCGFKHPNWQFYTTYKIIWFYNFIFLKNKNIINIVNIYLLYLLYFYCSLVCFKNEYLNVIFSHSPLNIYKFQMLSYMKY